MTIKKTFESSLLELATNRDIKQVFYDFLEITVSVFTANSSFGKTLEAYSRYTKIEVKEQFPAILYQLLEEMHSRDNDQKGNDVLGEFCEKYYYQEVDEKRILSWKECEKAAMNAIPRDGLNFVKAPVELLDVGCRSGRIMMSAYKKYGSKLAFHGVEYDWVYILISTLNLYFSNVKSSEVLLIDQANENAFQSSFIISPLPMLIIRNEKAEYSKGYEVYKVYLRTKEILKKSN